MALIKLKAIQKSYGSASILQDVNLSVEPEESVAIMGRSGAGKSTLLNIVGLLDDKTAGSYELFGKPLPDSIHFPALRNQTFGFIFQAFHLLSHRTVLDNVCLPFEYHPSPPKDATLRAFELLEAVGLLKEAHQYPTLLSGGQRQRVAIARSLITQPALLLADEFTGNLDAKTAEDIIVLIFQLQAQHHMALLWVTHDSRLAKRCRTAYQLEEGGLCRL
jgi:putative ABC transport system ATP-binding protein